MTMISNEYVKEQLCDSFMARFISNMVTYTATQATQQRCNTWFFLIILLDKCTRDLSAMDLWLCAFSEVI